MDYLPGTQLFLKQDKNMFRMNTDSVLLGEFLRVKRDQTVLDVGTNNGVLLLYASQYAPKKLIGIDTLAPALELAKENLALNKVSEYQFHVMDFAAYTETVDCILCNPPYFKSDFTNANENLRTARHQDELTLNVIFQKSAQVLSDGGSLFLIYPAAHLEEIMVLATQSKLHVKRLCIVYKSSKQQAHVVLVECRKGAKSACRIEPPLTIR